jgi:hypothetical protein
MADADDTADLQHYSSSELDLDQLNDFLSQTTDAHESPSNSMPALSVITTDAHETLSNSMPAGAKPTNSRKCFYCDLTLNRPGGPGFRPGSHECPHAVFQDDGKVLCLRLGCRKELDVGYRKPSQHRGPCAKLDDATVRRDACKKGSYAGDFAGNPVTLPSPPPSRTGSNMIWRLPCFFLQ